MTPASSIIAPGKGRSMAVVQLLAVLLCLSMNLMDGFDLLAMSFTAPAVAAEWTIAPDRLGLLFSAGLAGMAAGALALSPLADIIGRRRTILLCLVFVASGMIGAGMSHSFAQLSAARIVTGIGVGAIISSTGAMVYEFASDRYRGLAMGAMAVCFPAGATLGGGVALLLIDGFGWRGVFLAGGAATAVLIPLVALYLPESPSFLAQTGHAADAERARDMLARMERPLPIAARPAERQSFAGKIAEIVGPGLRRSSLALGGLFLLVMLSFYFIINWAPKLVTMLGATGRDGIAAGLYLNIGGMAGGLIAGLAISRYGLSRVTQVAVGAMGLAVGWFGIAASAGGAILISSALGLGFTMFATMASIYMLLAAAFPPRVRVTAAGLIATAGRVGSVLGPLVGGSLLAAGLTPELICILLAVPALMAAMLVRLSPPLGE
ncbi:MFS transporter [Sphingomonas metalli]|uniref:MFS transporter n=1 Tax=Sphingomonas metalli TaxID=1779358 RepID=A0A916TGM4_9SPHN|nr:MFS transporter [Sphingomonas metalli]GGB42955.1 MFS transporter [Sphingomonas metalli]